ncbi:unnamed protein product [Thlaspi arvense]|uniref:Pectinesterase inhibitor domain-containing protein n=1 Tax=Thlaspi arvense TaxID=13288 RepID=A0AAU9RYG1_THLAR|nr:unnamed protein product [Thlaspi arvense]
MNNFMKLFAIFVLFIQIQIVLSQNPHPVSAPGPNLIQQLCKRNRHQSLCVSTLNLDPRSKTSNLQGLASISIDATSKKVNETIQYLISVMKDLGGGREGFERYGTCIEGYGASIRRFLPAALADLKAKKYSQAVSDINDVVIQAPVTCQQQFPGKGPVPLTERNQATHDIADMTADIIKTFVN